MERSKVFFSAEDSEANHELYQLLNWQFQVSYYHHAKDATFDEIKQVSPALMIISADEKNYDVKDLLAYMKNECTDIPVVLLGEKEAIQQLVGTGGDAQIHLIERPVTGKRVLEVCKAVIQGEGYTEGALTRDPNEKYHVLVVDDNAMMLRNIKSILDAKYSVAVAPSGLKAFASMRKQMPDLILLDYEMPEMNGKEVLEKIQADPALNEIPVVFLTSVDSRMKVINLLALKPAGYILKPAEPELLLNKLAAILGH